MQLYTSTFATLSAVNFSKHSFCVLIRNAAVLSAIACRKTVQICRSVLLSKRPSGTANFHRQNVQCCVVATEFRRCVCSGYQKVKLCRKGAISATSNDKCLQKAFPTIDTFSEFRRCVCSGYQKVKLCRKGAISATGVVKGLQKVFPTIDTV